MGCGDSRHELGPSEDRPVAAEAPSAAPPLPTPAPPGRPTVTLSLSDADVLCREGYCVLRNPFPGESLADARASLLAPESQQNPRPNPWGEFLTSVAAATSDAATARALAESRSGTIVDLRAQLQSLQAALLERDARLRASADDQLLMRLMALAPKATAATASPPLVLADRQRPSPAAFVCGRCNEPLEKAPPPTAAPVALAPAFVPAPIPRPPSPSPPPPPSLPVVVELHEPAQPPAEPLVVPIRKNSRRF